MKVIHICRKPLSESSVAANVLKHGTGALNIDGCRLSTSDSLNGGAYSGSLRRRDEYSSSDKAEGATALSRLNRGVGEFQQPTGRWPANLILEHLSECRSVGTKEIKSQSGAPVTGLERSTPGKVTYAGGWGKTAATRWYADSGKETVDAWNCAPGCPVATLDAESGDVRSAGNYPSTPIRSDNHIYSARKGQQGQLYADKGGASRFFKQVGGTKK